MGKGFNNYMTKKFFHPGSKENIKRVWMAEQKAEYDKTKQEELLNQYQKEHELYGNRALLGDEKAKLGLSFMYDAPPGMKKEKEREDDEPEYKFEWQRKFNAPRESYAKNDEAIRDQPFGIEVRNVRCIKCRKWGHVNTDKICPLYGQNLTAEPPQPSTSASSLLESLEDDGYALKQSIMGASRDPNAKNQQMIGSDDEDDPEVKFLKSLTPKQKKKLLKKLSKLQRKQSENSKLKKHKKSKKRQYERQSDSCSTSSSEVDERNDKSKKSRKQKSRIYSDDRLEKDCERKCSSNSGERKDKYANKTDDLVTVDKYSNRHETKRRIRDESEDSDERRSFKRSSKSDKHSQRSPSHKSYDAHHSMDRSRSREHDRYYQDRHKQSYEIPRRERHKQSDEIPRRERHKQSDEIPRREKKRHRRNRSSSEES